MHRVPLTKLFQVMSDYWKLFLWWHLWIFQVHLRSLWIFLPQVVILDLITLVYSNDIWTYIPIWTCMCQHNPDWSTKESWSLFSIETDFNLSREWNVSGRIELIGFDSTWIWTMWTREFKKPGWSSMKLLPERVKSFKGFKLKLKILSADQISENESESELKSSISKPTSRTGSNWTASNALNTHYLDEISLPKIITELVTTIVTIVTFTNLDYSNKKQIIPFSYY